MVETIHPICQDDTKTRSKHDYNGQDNYRTIQRRTELEMTIKDIFIWALEEAVTEMAKTVSDNDPNKMNIYSVFIS